MSLIELMITVTLGLLLIATLVDIDIVSHRSNQLQWALSHLKNNAQTTMTILYSDIRKAGYIGCPRLSADFPLTSYQTYTLTVQNQLEARNPNEITVRHMSYPSVNLIEPLQDSVTLYTSREKKFSPKDILIIADCKHAELFQANTVSISKDRQKIVSLHPLHDHYERYAEIGRFEVNRYFIAKTHRTHLDGSPIYSLFLEDIKKHKRALVDDVTQLRVFYSLRQNNNIIDVPANEVSDFNNRVGVAMDADVIAASLHKTWHLYVRV